MLNINQISSRVIRDSDFKGKSIAFILKLHLLELTCWLKLKMQNANIPPLTPLLYKYALLPPWVWYLLRLTPTFSCWRVNKQLPP